MEDMAIRMVERVTNSLMRIMSEQQRKVTTTSMATIAIAMTPKDTHQLKRFLKATDILERYSQRQSLQKPSRDQPNNYGFVLLMKSHDYPKIAAVH